MADNPLFCEFFNDFIFIIIKLRERIFSDALKTILSKMNILTGHEVTATIKSDVVLLYYPLQIRCGNNGARHKLYAVKITATSVRIHRLLIRNLYWYSGSKGAPRPHY